MHDGIGAALPEGVADGDFVIATYLRRTAHDVDIDVDALALAELQSTGTWMAIPAETATIRERHAGRVIATWEVPDHELTEAGTSGPRTWVMQVAYPAHNIGDQIPLLLATVYGECASLGTAKLIDLKLPRSFVSAQPGPRFGSEGIRQRLGVTDRPLLVAMMKPALGLSPSESAEVFRQLALGGADAVKDDELLVSHPWSHFEERAREHHRVAHAVHDETGHTTLYFVNITDRPDHLIANARRAIAAGASGLMVDFVTVGIAALSMLADDDEIDVPILGHLAFAGAMYASPWTGVSSHLILGKLPRLAGADIIVYPSPYGSLDFSRSKHLRLARAMTAELHGTRATMPVPGGGLHPALVPSLVDDLGSDIAIGAGGAIHGHPMGVRAGARAFRQAIDAIVRDDDLSDAAGEYEELAVALRSWPVTSPSAGEWRR